MVLMIMMQLGMMLVNMGIQLAFYAAAAYVVALMAHKGWKAGK